MAFFLRAVRPAAGAALAASAGFVAAQRFQGQQWQPKSEALLRCEASKSVSRQGSISSTDKKITHDTLLYKAYENRFGTGKNVQLTFTDVFSLLKDIGIKNPYLGTRIFQAMDEDHSGTVDFKEMNHFCHTLAMGTKSEKAKFMFDACDVNSNGTVEYSEMRKMIKNLNLACHETLPSFVLVKTEADVALTEELDVDQIATLMANRLAFEIYHVCDHAKAGKINFKEFNVWVTRGTKAAQEFSHYFDLLEHLMAKH